MKSNTFKFGILRVLGVCCFVLLAFAANAQSNTSGTTPASLEGKDVPAAQREQMAQQQSEQYEAAKLQAQVEAQVAYDQDKTFNATLNDVMTARSEAATRGEDLSDFDAKIEQLYKEFGKEMPVDKTDNK